MDINKIEIQKSSVVVNGISEHRTSSGSFVMMKGVVLKENAHIPLYPKGTTVYFIDYTLLDDDLGLVHFNSIKVWEKKDG